MCIRCASDVHPTARGFAVDTFPIGVGSPARVGHCTVSRLGGGGISAGGEARQHLVAHRELVERRGDRDRRRLHVVLDDALVGVEVGVMRVRVVFDRILAEADARAGRRC